MVARRRWPMDPHAMSAVTLWPVDELPESTPDTYAAAALRLSAHDNTDRAQYIRARAAGIRWTCPNQCTDARGDECSCPCGRRCHGARHCPGH